VRPGGVARRSRSAAWPPGGPRRGGGGVPRGAGGPCAWGTGGGGGEPFRTPFGPSLGASAGMPSRGTPAPPLATSEIFSSRVIWARSAFTWRGVGRGAVTPIDDAAPAATSAAPARASNRRGVRFTRRGYAGGSLAVNENCAGSGARDFFQSGGHAVQRNLVPDPYQRSARRPQRQRVHGLESLQAADDVSAVAHEIRTD